MPSRFRNSKEHEWGRTHTIAALDGTSGLSAAARQPGAHPPY
jgi:hypothetical protein